VGGAVTVGRVLVVCGLALVAVGVALLLGARLPLPGRLPGDIVLRRGPVTLFLPVATSLLVSVVLTLLLWLWRR